MLWLQSEECLEKTLETVKVLAKPSDEGPKHYLLTGAIMQNLAKQLLGLRYASTPKYPFPELSTDVVCNLPPRRRPGMSWLNSSGG